VESDILALVARSSLVMGLGLVAALLLRRRSAALRHRLLVLAFAAAVVVGPVAAIVPTWRLPLPVPTPSDLSASAVGVTSVPPVASASPTASTGRALAARGPSISLAEALLGLWLVGACAATVRLLAGCFIVNRLCASAAAPTDNGWKRLLAQVSDRYGLGQAVCVGVTDRQDVLATFGAVNPTVLLPAASRGWTSERLRVVLLHELAHIKRADWPAQLFAEAVCALYWFNPLFWLACARLRHEGERACDDEVLAVGVRPDVYAEHLIEIARAHRHTPWAVVVPMARPSTLERRVTAMLSTRIDRRTPGRGVVAVTAAVVVAVMVVVAGLTVSAQSDALSVEGTIFDPTGGVLPGANVALVDANKTAVPATTDRAGRFRFQPVEAGSYVLEASLPGFKSLRHEFTLATGSGRTHAITLQVGSLEETITATAKRPAAGQAAARTAPVRMGGNIRVPSKVLDVHPVYPEAMQTAGLEGVVPINAVIGIDGSVVSVRVASAQVNPEFAASAVTAVRQWRFTPTLLNGAPVEVEMSVSISFKLTD